MNRFQPGRTVLFVHGATYPAHTSFDLQLGGMSWMDYIAARGYDVYLLDLRGYGKSTRPKEMDDKPEANPPIVRGDVAVKDIGSVVDFILKRRNIPRLNLIGWSWGTTLMATYTSQNPKNVERLVLYAPVWIRTTPSLVQAGPGPLGAYRTVRREQALERWLTGVPEEKKATLIPAGWFDAWADATWATDPVGAKMNPPVVRARKGVLRSGENRGSDASGPSGMGPRHAALYGADAVPLARELARQALRAARRRNPHDRHGAEPAQAFRGGSGVPRRSDGIVGGWAADALGRRQRSEAARARPRPVDTPSRALLNPACFPSYCRKKLGRAPAKGARRALSSAGERSLHTGEVVGSIPTAPTSLRGCNAAGRLAVEKGGGAACQPR